MHTPRHRLLAAGTVAGLLLAVLLAPGAWSTNDEHWDRQYGPRQIQADSAWTVTRGEDVIVAIVDSGVDVDHPDLKDKLVIIPGSDPADGDDDPDDDSEAVASDGRKVKGHGTHVAGIAAATTDNGIGIAGVAPDAKIMPIKVFGENSVGGFATAVPLGIQRAVDAGAKVLNLSIGTISGVELVGIIETPCANAFNRGALCIIASGNSGDQPSGYERNTQAVIVTANDSTGAHADFGQHADTKWAVSAPGVAIMSTIPVEDGMYAALQGTSMAAPHVAGVAALLFAQGLSAADVAERLVETADLMPNRRVNGAGRVNAARAVGAPVRAEATDTTTPAPSETPPPAAGGIAGLPDGPSSNGTSSDGSSGADLPGGDGGGESLDGVDEAGGSEDLDFTVSEQAVAVAAEDNDATLRWGPVVVFTVMLAALTALAVLPGIRSRNKRQIPGVS